MMKIKTDVNTVVSPCRYAGIGIKRGFALKQVPELVQVFGISVNDVTIG